MNCIDNENGLNGATASADFSNSERNGQMIETRSPEHVLEMAQLYKQCIREIGRSDGDPLVVFSEYCYRFAEMLGRFGIEKYGGDRKDAVCKCIEDLLPYRDEAVHLFSLIAKRAKSGALVKEVHHLFERLIPYMGLDEATLDSKTTDFDSYRFFVHELFLYALAVFLKDGRFRAAAYFLGEWYCVPPNLRRASGESAGFWIMMENCRSLRDLRRGDEPEADWYRDKLLRDRCSNRYVGLEDLQQADFVAFLRNEVDRFEADDRGDTFMPR